MQDNVVIIENLFHKYSASWVLQDINFKITCKGVLGLLGSNGAGKSTTMNILCGVLNQTGGNVLIDVIDIRKYPLEAKRKIGYLPQIAPLHMELTIDEYLIYCAHLRLMDKESIPTALAETKDRCGISHFGKRIIGNLSGGYRQRVGIAQAIIHKPKLVVLDEATNGLDPNQILEVRKLIHEISEERSVIFSSHILSEVQATCRDIIMIEDGRMVFSDTIDVFNNYIQPNSIIIKLGKPPSMEMLGAIEGITNLLQVNDKKFRLKFENAPDITERLVSLSIEKEWHLIEISFEKSSLDQIFAQLSNKAKN
jgi:ABC-2 type transport system ATP-binding protein